MDASSGRRIVGHDAYDFPSEAIRKANAATAKCQLSQAPTPDHVVAAYLHNIKPVLDELGARAAGYIQEIHGAIKFKLHVTAMPEDPLPDKMNDPMNRRAITFLKALLEELSSLASVRGEEDTI